VNGADEPHNYAKAEEENGRDTHEPKDEIDDELARPFADEDCQGWTKECKQVSHDVPR
jgi:hypothetical protein